MNPILEQKLQELDRAKEYECWYLVKQPTAFGPLCYLVSFLRDFKTQAGPGNLQDYIGRRIDALRAEKPDLAISNNYRALRVAAFFGLIQMTSAKYETAVITEAFEEITHRCGGEYERTETYQDMIQRQIEKMYISSAIDEEYQGVRQDYRLYPVMLLYKVLLELGRSTGSYCITMAEYRYFVATTKTFQDFLDTLLLIRLLRQEPAAVPAFERYSAKFDNRLIQALKQLPPLAVERDAIALKPGYVEEAARKVYLFESNPEVFVTDRYLEFLGSTQSLFELERFEQAAASGPSSPDRATGGANILLYGVPGAGKSWTIQHDYCADDSRMERLVFHPDYTCSDFIGQILPSVRDGLVSYSFVPGPFTRLLKRAYEDPGAQYFLIIEEINRGNAPAIFGEVFQLLDRDGRGESEYGITNGDIAGSVYADPSRKVRIPSNMSIIGTMNTADQSVFPLDTAFQRRWTMRMIKNTFENHAYAAQPILDTHVTWQRFCRVMNREITSKNIRVTSSEDKRLGAYFVRSEDLVYHAEADDAGLPAREQAKARLLNCRFAEKVLKYLWDDAFRFSREDIFKSSVYPSLEAVAEHFSTGAVGDGRLDVFQDEIIDALLAEGRPNAEV